MKILVMYRYFFSFTIIKSIDTNINIVNIIFYIIQNNLENYCLKSIKFVDMLFVDIFYRGYYTKKN